MLAITPYRTPGISVSEIPAFPPSVVGAPTAVPAFLGYTEKAVSDGVDVTLQPILITSLADYKEVFGEPPAAAYTLTAAAAGAKADVTLGGAGYTLTPTPQSKLLLYRSLQLFYMNGGGLCYIVSVGSYTDAAKGVTTDALQAGLDVIAEQTGPTLLLAPDALLLPADTPAVAPLQTKPAKTAGGTAPPPPAPAGPAGPPVSAAYGTFAAAAVDQCATLTDRMAILDVYGADQLAPLGPGFSNHLATFIDGYRNSIATIQPGQRGYAAAYFPFLATTLVSPSDIDFSAFDLSGAASVHPASVPPSTTPGAAKTDPKSSDDKPDAKHDPKSDAASGSEPSATGAGGLGVLQTALAAAADLVGDAARAQAIKDKLVSRISPALATTAGLAERRHLNQALLGALPELGQVYAAIAAHRSLMPPCGAVAGVFTSNDDARGVWEAPANLPLAGVIRPLTPISDFTQQDLNAPIEGLAINCIRSLPGRGHLIWGARTLDANSLDNRYVQVRRALIYIETSIREAMNRFVFEANVEQTWSSVTAMVGSFLNELWTRGGLMGAKATDAYTVQCGLGKTMVGDDVLQGRMIVDVTLTLVHPAEFISLRFKQQMSGATTI